MQLIVVSFLSLLLIAIYAVSMIGIIFPEGKLLGDNGTLFLFSGVGGLVTAFAISFLAVNQPNSVPTEGLTLTTAGSGSAAKTIQKVIPLLFVLTWLVSGAIAVYFGLLAQNSIEALTEGGKAWTGSVLAAVGAYWGITGPNPETKG